MKARDLIEAESAKAFKDSDVVGKPITGVEFNGARYTFYPYTGPVPAWEYPHLFNDKQPRGILGYIKTREGKLHGRFFTSGQFFKFEPGK